MRKQDETMPAADECPIERDVRPAAAWSLIKDGEPYKLMYERDDRGPSYEWEPLYNQSALDAERERMNQHAVTLAETARLVEQERCARLCRRLRSLDGDFLARAIENESSVNWPRQPSA